MTPLAPTVPPGVFSPALEEALRTVVAPVADALGPVSRVVVGWATVDLERAASELGVGEPTALSDDDLLGARCAALPATDRAPLVLLEPITEGRLAASLARHGEGPVVLYLVVPAPTLARFRTAASAAGIRVSAPAAGPFGEATLVLGGAVWGPHLVVAGEPRSVASDECGAAGSGRRGAATIRS